MEVMFEGWSEFYLLAGSAAAVLIGLIFVVVTLMQDRPRSSVLNGSRLYMGPVALHVSFVLVLSAAALVPGISPSNYAVVSGAVSIWGLARSVSGIFGIRALTGADTPHWTDVWFYGGASDRAVCGARGGLAGGLDGAPVGRARHRRDGHRNAAADHPQRVGSRHLAGAATGFPARFPVVAQTPRFAGMSEAN